MDIKSEEEGIHLPIALVKELEVVHLHRVEKHEDKVAVLNELDPKHSCLPKMPRAYLIFKLSEHLDEIES